MLDLVDGSVLANAPVFVDGMAAAAAELLAYQ